VVAKNFNVVLWVLSVVSLLLALVSLVGVIFCLSENSVEERLSAVESEIALLREKTFSHDTPPVPVKDLFTVASLEEQMKRLRADFERMKAQQRNRADAETGGVAEERQERALREISRAFQRTWKIAFEDALAKQGFDEDSRRTVTSDYGTLLEQIEEIQVRWLRGEINWEGALDEIKMRSLEFYDGVERRYDTDTARRVLDIAFPTPEMKRFFLSGSNRRVGDE